MPPAETILNAPSDLQFMARALELAGRGQGRVEPNPMVGCVIAREGHLVAEGWHQSFGGPHAEIEALSQAGCQAAGSTMYVTLEPCCHYGKTPPCTDAIIRAKIKRVVIAQRDPFPLVDGGGLTRLREAGVEVQVGLLEGQARELNSPYLKLIECGRPWVVAKWAITLDGKIATHTGHSQWISGESSRAIVHQIRGRMDAIVVGVETVNRDDPQLTARPPGPRTAARVVLDSEGSTPLSSQLVQSAKETPVIIATSQSAPTSRLQPLRDAGCEVVPLEGASHAQRLKQLLDVLGIRRMTNILVEGGARVLGSLWDMRAIDEVHVFVATKLVGGGGAPSALAGVGCEEVPVASTLQSYQVERCDDDIYIRGRLKNGFTARPRDHG